MKSCLILTPATHVSYRAPIKPKFEGEDFQRMWRSEPIHIFAKDVVIHPQRTYEGVRWTMYLKRNQLGRKFKQGSRISFAYSDDEEPIRYIVTWKRRAYTRHSLIEVVAYTRLQQVIEPYNEAWPAFVLGVDNDDCVVPFSPELERYWAGYERRKAVRERVPEPLFFKEFSKAHNVQLNDTPTTSQGFLPSLFSCFARN